MKENKQICMMISANHLSAERMLIVVPKKILMKYMNCVNQFLMEILSIIAPTKISIKYVVRANHFVIDVAERDPHR